MLIYLLSIFRHCREDRARSQTLDSMRQLSLALSLFLHVALLVIYGIFLVYLSTYLSTYLGTYLDTYLSTYLKPCQSSINAFLSFYLYHGSFRYAICASNEQRSSRI